MRYITVLVVMATLAPAGACDQLERTSDTVEACTAALQAEDAIADGRPEADSVRDFYEAALGSKNDELVALAERAQDASAERDADELAAILDQAQEVCEDEGAI